MIDAVLKGRSFRILCGDAREQLDLLPAGSVHAVVTSPPYWALRSYLPAGDPRKAMEIGAEATPEEYVTHLVEVLRAVRRVLRDDGVVWLNLGDTFAATRSYQVTDSKHVDVGNTGGMKVPDGLKAGDLIGVPWRVAFALQADGWWLRGDVVWSKASPMPESVNGVRWERCRKKVRSLASAERRGGDHQRHTAGERRRGDAPHSAKAGESSTFAPTADYEDCAGCSRCQANGGLVLRRGSWRPTRSHEFVFQLAKSPDYFCDAQAVAEEAVRDASGNAARKVATEGERSRTNTHLGSSIPWAGTTRNPRSVWHLNPEPFSAAGLGVDVDHYAVMPPTLVEKCLRASVSERGCCSVCGAPWARVVERERPAGNDVKVGGDPDRSDAGWRVKDETGAGGNQLASAATRTVGWRTTCEHDAPITRPLVLDPFNGAGTTGLVATRLGCRYIGIELRPEYARLAERRIYGDAPLFHARGLL